MVIRPHEVWILRDRTPARCSLNQCLRPRGMQTEQKDEKGATRRTKHARREKRQEEGQTGASSADAQPWENGVLGLNVSACGSSSLARNELSSNPPLAAAAVHGLGQACFDQSSRRCWRASSTLVPRSYIMRDPWMLSLELILPHIKYYLDTKDPYDEIPLGAPGDIIRGCPAT